MFYSVHPRIFPGCPRHLLSVDVVDQFPVVLIDAILRDTMTTINKHHDNEDFNYSYLVELNSSVHLRSLADRMFSFEAGPIATQNVVRPSDQSLIAEAVNFRSILEREKNKYQRTRKNLDVINDNFTPL